jgi:hypothetical protein
MRGMTFYCNEAVPYGKIAAVVLIAGPPVSYSSKHR